LLATLVFGDSPVCAGNLTPVALEELTRTGDLICKATVISDRRVTDDSFEPIFGFEVHEAELRIVSIVKGAAPNAIQFRYYAPTMPDLSRDELERFSKAMPELSRAELVQALRELSREQLEQLVKAMPKLGREQLEKLKNLFKAMAPEGSDTPTIATERTYLVVATQTGGGAYRQLGKMPLFVGPMAHSVLLAADAKPHHGTTLSEAAWAELLALLKSPVEGDVIGAIRNLDYMSGGPAWNQPGSSDFERSQALVAIEPLVGAKSVAIATAAITVFGMDSPYFEDPYEHDLTAAHWFVGIGKGHITGLAARKRPPSPLAAIGAKELLQVATDGATPEVRALAIRALGRRSHAYPAAMVAVWVRDPSIAVRRAGVLASADLPDREPIITASTNASPDLRCTAALAIGFAQDPGLVPILGKLLQDPVADVRNAAAMSLLSFAPDPAAPVMEANLASDFRPLFVNALASGNPQPYLEMLAEVIEEQGVGPADWKRPENWNYGGVIPAADSWRILFDFVKSRPAAELTAGKLDRSLDALERMHWFGSGEPTSLYALYLSRGLLSRAKQFRDTTRKSVPFDMDLYFDRVDRDSAAYLQ
jgi:HEAT repeat protein